MPIESSALTSLASGAQAISNVVKAVGLGASALTFFAGSSSLPNILGSSGASSAIAAAGAGVVKSLASSIPTLAQVSLAAAPALLRETVLIPFSQG